MKEIRHIIISDPHDCCGCTACASICPRGCITMEENREGFLYPSVNEDTCIECGLCAKVCPVIHRSDARRPLAVYAMKHRDTAVRERSASGGAFPLLAEAILRQGGTVFGSRYDSSMEAVHDSATTPEGIIPFIGSKYLQSRMEDCYGRVRAALREGRPVLFTGTACQVAGLNRFLSAGAGKVPTDKLLTAELICHGVPSPGVWRQYLNEEKAALEAKGYTDVKIEGANFRDKEEGRAGWKGYRFKIFFSAKDPSGVPCRPELSEAGKAENLFIRGFLSDFYSRPSCYRCPAREFRSGSDLTIGDFWGIGDLRPEFDDDRGVSAILVNTEKGREFLAAISAPDTRKPYSSGSSESSDRSILPDLSNSTLNSDSADMLQMTLEDVLRRNRCLLTSVDETPARAAFFQACPDLRRNSATPCDIHGTIRSLLGQTHTN